MPTPNETLITFDQLRKIRPLNFKIPRPVPRFWRRRARMMYLQWVRKAAKKKLATWFSDRIDALCPRPPIS